MHDEIRRVRDMCQDSFAINSVAVSGKDRFVINALKLQKGNAVWVRKKRRELLLGLQYKN